MKKTFSIVTIILLFFGSYLNAYTFKVRNSLGNSAVIKINPGGVFGKTQQRTLQPDETYSFNFSGLSCLGPESIRANGEILTPLTSPTVCKDVSINLRNIETSGPSGPVREKVWELIDE